MNRVCYSPKFHKKVKIIGCSTCQYSRLADDYKYDKKEKNPCLRAKVVDLKNGTVQVTSKCSGDVNIYPIEIIKLEK